jgi:capsular exopolysaccharide synthesis family protein
LNDVRKRWGFTDLEERNFRHLIDERLANLELEQNRLVLEVRQVQAIAENLERQATGPINEQVEDQIENDPIMINLAQQIALRESALAAIMTKFGENHRIVRETQKLIDEIIQKREIRKAKIAEQTRQANLKNAQDRLVVQSKSLEQLGKMLDETSAKKKDLDSARVQYDQRAAIRDERKLMLNEIKEKIEKLKIIYDDPETPKVQSVGYAPVPLEMSFPQARIFFPGGTMLGLLFGVGLAFLIELLNDLVRTPIDVSRYLHIPLLGVIPDAAEDDQLRNIQLCQVVHQAPYSMVSESYRRFRTNLKLSESAQSSKILLVTSGMPGDGKTSVAINLATTFIAEGKKVLLIDTNFRRPGLHKIFPKPQDATDAGKPEMPEQLDLGLSELLAGRCQPHQVIRSTGIEGFDIIDSGSIPPNPAELLGSIEMQQLVQQQRQSYDYVILDGPPVLLLSDAKVLARVVDGAVLIFNADATRRGAALRSIRELRQVDATIVGCVLLAVKAMKGGYFREQFKSFRQYQKLQLASPV